MTQEPRVSFDVEAVRARFPALKREVAGRPAVFADAPGGTQVPFDVLDALSSYLERSNANRGGAFVTSFETDEIIEDARSAMADFLNCDAGEVVFGANMTTLAFALSRSLARELDGGDEVVVTRLDHDANISPWVAAAEDAGAKVRWVDFSGAFRLDLESLDQVLNERTKIVAFTLASNALGTITDARAVVERAHRAGALVIADAVHFAPHRLIDVRALGVDVLFCSAYKFFGPHAGVMYARRELLDAWHPYRVRPSSDHSPWRWETGTANHEGIAGVAACVDYIANLVPGSGNRRGRIVNSMQVAHEHQQGLTERFLRGISGLDGVTLYGPDDVDRTSTFALRVRGQHPDDTAKRFAECGIFVWSGNYYALAVMEALDLEESGGATRIGFCHYSTAEEVDYALDVLGRIAATG
ncbi:MAG: cysteine desulfurase-like protein [Actinomycetota bacterium]